MACGEFYLSIGIVFIDDIILPDGESRMARLGGGAVHAVMGMRLWGDHVGLISPLGSDFPESLHSQMGELFDIQGVKSRPVLSPRAWMVYEEDGTRHEVFRTDPNQMIAALIHPEECPEEYNKAKGIHLHCAAEQVPVWVEFLRSNGNPVILWEPWDRIMIPENRALFRQNAALVDVVSPNLKEGRLLTGKSEPLDVLQTLLDLGASRVALRMGEYGSLIGDGEGRRIWVPGLTFEPIVDVTGAGNAYCGGFVVGLARSGDLLQAGCSGAVSASFALQQFGAVYDLRELHEDVEDRFETIFANTPNPRRIAFDQLAEVWDEMVKTHTNSSVKLRRIGKAGALKSGSRVLDIGTGTGGLLPTIAEYEPASVLAIDLSIAMLQKARSNHPLISVQNALLLQADALFLPIGDEMFDAVYCHGVFPHMKEIPVALKEIWRVLVPGGRLIISHAIGRERVNAIHSHHRAAILRDDLLPTGSELATILEERAWLVLECEDNEDIYLVTAQKPKV